MAKSNRRQRDVITHTSVATRPRVLPSPVSLRLRPFDLSRQYSTIHVDPLDDARRYQPLTNPAPRRFKGPEGRLLQPRPNKRGYASRHAVSIPSQLLFQAPSKLLICVRRKVRKQVLFAQGVGGSRRPRRSPRFNFWSTIGC